MSSPTPAQRSEQVTLLLHSLRGEALRHQRNLQGGRIRAPPSLSQGPSLPPTLFVVDDGNDTPTPDVPRPRNVKSAGPPPPRSWGSTSGALGPSSPEWRRNALSFVFDHTVTPSKAISPESTSVVPTLFQAVLHKMLVEWGGLPPDLFPYLPRHLLREYVRYSAVYAPLSKEDLEVIWFLDDAGSVDGEVIITGPFASSIMSRSVASPPDIPDDWDSNGSSFDPDPPPALHTFVVLSAPFTPSLMSLLPTTLTRLPLINVQRLPVQNLPIQVPLLIFLDLSYNIWIGDAIRRALRTNWRKWPNLEVLGLRGCGITPAEAKSLGEAVNKGRLTDVNIVISG